MDKEQYNKEIEDAREFIKKVEKFKPKSQQILEDYKRAREFIQMPFNEWLKYKKSIINVRGLGIWVQNDRNRKKQ